MTSRRAFPRGTWMPEHGRRANALGKSAEDACVLCSPHGWIESARHATPEEDANGIDAVLTTVLGEVPVQVKSSMAGAEQRRLAYPEIPYIIIHSGDSQRLIQTKARAACRWLLRKTHGNKVNEAIDVARIEAARLKELRFAPDPDAAKGGKADG